MVGDTLNGIRRDRITNRLLLPNRELLLFGGQLPVTPSRLKSKQPSKAPCVGSVLRVSLAYKGLAFPEAQPPQEGLYARTTDRSATDG